MAHKHTHSAFSAFVLACFLLASLGVQARKGMHGEQSLLVRAEVTLTAVRQHFATAGGQLLQEAVPAQEGQNACSYLWGYSAMLSASCALYEAHGEKRWLRMIDRTMLPGLDHYRDTLRSPVGYASYVVDAPPSDRFYDDNIWLGIDMADLYARTHKSAYLKRAEEIWRFVMSGRDDALGGGIYWCEQKRESKNACSNAPASVFALKMYCATNDLRYLDAGKALYGWTRTHLLDEADGLISDNIRLDGRIDRTKYSYNTGQMVQAAAMLYSISGEEHYLGEAQAMARAAYNAFFADKQCADGLRRLRGGDPWFDAVMLRGYLALFALDHNPLYLRAMRASVDEAWSTDASRDEGGLFGRYYDAREKDRPKTLLVQAAMIEMMARLAAVEDDI